MLDVIKVLESVKDSLPKPSGLISIADLIVLAGQVALKNAGNVSIPFSGGRTDALDGGISGKLAPRTYYNSSIAASRDNMKIMGLSPHLWVALAGRPRSIVQQIRLGYSGSYTTDSTKFNNQYFQVLLANQWQLRSNTSLIPEYKSIDKDLFVLETDMALIWDNEFKAIVQEYATNEQWFKDNFAKAWNLLMNADMFILDKQTNNGASSVFSCSFSIVFSIILSIYVNLK
jgi:catalase (peroxidase I)